MKLCTASSCPSATALAGRPRFCFSSGAQPSVRQQPRPRHTSASWNDLAGPEHAALLVTTVRAALLPVHHYLPRAAARLRSMCAKAVRFPAGAWPPHHGRAALPRPGQARPGLLRLLPAGGGHRMTCRAGLRGLLRGVTHLLRQVTSSGPQRLKALRWWFIITTRKARFSACQSLLPDMILESLFSKAPTLRHRL